MPYSLRHFESSRRLFADLGRFSLPAALLAGVGLLASCLASGCVPAGDGVSPPPERIYFPVGLAVDAGSQWLYVVNSDFDLQFNQGTVQSLDLAAIGALTPTPCSRDSDCAADEVCDSAATDENRGRPSFFCVDGSGELAGLPCGELEVRGPGDKAFAPGPCAPIDPSSLIKDVVEISAFATAGRLVEQREGGEVKTQRLFVPVRGDASLHWLDLSDGKIDCGQDAAVGDRLGRCAEDHKISSGVSPSGEEVDLAPEPFDIAVSDDGSLLVVTHQDTAEASVFVNDWVSPPRWVQTSTENMPDNPMNVAALPAPAASQAMSSSAEYVPGFLMTSRSEARLHLLRFFDDGLLDGSDEARPEFFSVASGPITAVANGVDSRGIAIDDSRRREAERRCVDDVECLGRAARIPLDVYVANRSPNSLLVGSTDSVDGTLGVQELPSFHDSIPLTAGPSRVVLGRVMNAQGEYERRVFVICFDSALIYVYDPVRGEIETEIDTGRGPHALAFHRELPLLYVGHFTDSYIGVVSLDGRFPRAFGSTLAIVGSPTQPRASK